MTFAQSKPAERRGRRATGLKKFINASMPAEPPKEILWRLLFLCAEGRDEKDSIK
jgi:hypothetical protein